MTGEPQADDRDWRLLAIDGALAERKPDSRDPEVWAQWCERKAQAAEMLRDEAEQRGDHGGAAVAEHLREVTSAAAEQLRREVNT